MKKYLPIGRLIQDLEKAYVAATKARNLAHVLVCKVQKRSKPNADKLANARKQKSRATSNWNRIRAELKRYQKMVVNAFEVVCYGGVIVGRYKTESQIFHHFHSSWPSDFCLEFSLKCSKGDFQ